jgi:hypothetical protein
MADGCPSPFLRSPYVFAFAHFYYLPHFALPCYMHRHHPDLDLRSNLAITVAVAVTQAHRTKHARHFQIKRARTTPEWTALLLRTTTASPRQSPEVYTSSRFWDGCHMIFSGYHSERRGMGLTKGRSCLCSLCSFWQRMVISVHCCFGYERDFLQWISLRNKVLLPILSFRPLRYLHLH